jgi:hypothetical protein
MLMSRFICQTNWTDTVHYQSRMTSNGIAITPSLQCSVSRARQAGGLGGGGDEMETYDGPAWRLPLQCRQGSTRMGGESVVYWYSI